MEEPRERRLFVFGSNGECQLGIPAADIVDTPTRVPNPPKLEDIRSIHGGDNHTLILTHGVLGKVYCAGDNRRGQALLTVEEEIPRLEEFKRMSSAVSLIAATCESSALVITRAVDTGSRILTQGHGQWGELGYDVTAFSKSGPGVSEVEPLPGKVVDIAGGVWHYVAIVEGGSVYGWGKARLGQLGDNLSGKVTTPTRLEGIPFKPVRVTCGKDFTYLVGDPSTGEHIVLGKDKFNIVSDMPPNIAGWKDIGATWHAIFVLFNDGRLIAWGRNSMWELIPPDLPPIEKIAIGSEHVLAVTKDGKLISWGWGKHGNCGNFSNVGEKVKNDMISGFWNEIDVPGDVEFIGAGYCTSCVVTS
jgi:protein ATS1